MKNLFKAVLLITAVAIPVVAFIQWTQNRNRLTYADNLRDTFTAWNEGVMK
jgi:hypothetical protein